MKKTFKAIIAATVILLLPLFSRAGYRARISQNDTTTLKIDAQKAKDAGDPEAMDKAISSYIAELDGHYTRAQIVFLKQFATSTRSEAFRFFLTNQELIDKMAGKDFAENQIESLIHKEFLKRLTTGDVPDPDWKQLEDQMKPFGKPGQHILARTKWSFYYHKKDWNKFLTCLADYKNQYPDRAERHMNDDLWDFYEATSDKRLLKKAAEIEKWLIDSKAIMFKIDIPTYMDTYACILYRAGKRKEALIWMQKAVDELQKLPSDETNPDVVTSIQADLKKMQNNEPTWPENNDASKKG